RIPLDLYFHDNDGVGWDGNVGWSHLSTDHQWQNPGEWAYTWIGDTNKVSTVGKLVGKWKFDDANNLVKAEAGIGQALELVGSHEAITGPAEGNGAVKIGVGSHYKMSHGIAPNGGGAYVNEYSLMIDFKVPALGVWHALFQTNPANSNDGDCFIKPDGNIGVAATGYSTTVINANEWYRLVISVKNGTHYRYYLDGQLLHDGTVQSVDGRFALENVLLIFADEDGEDNEIHCADLAIWNYPLSANEIAALGGYHPTDVQENKRGVITTYELSQNYPNPFNPITTIAYAVPKSGQVKLQVFNQIGQQVATLIDGNQVAGSYKIEFNANDLPSGLYFYRMETEGFSKTMKMILMK
ncbi:MAG: T9SS type A sorting domain-containing protein, partial [Candidatus Zixiibacteriota bacterium]